VRRGQGVQAGVLPGSGRPHPTGHLGHTGRASAVSRARCSSLH